MSGDFPDIEVIKVVNSSDVNYSVTEDTRGVPDIDTAAVMLGGIISSPFSLASLNADGVSLHIIIEQTNKQTSSIKRTVNNYSLRRWQNK